MKIQKIPIDKIDSLFLSRVDEVVKAEDETLSDDIISLSSSIKQVGLIHPITVRKLKNGRYERIAGGRRVRGCRIAGLTEIDAIVLNEDVTDIEAYTMVLDENIKRKNLDAISRVETYLKLLAIEIEAKQNSFSKDKLDNNELLTKGRKYFGKALYAKRLMAAGDTVNITAEQLSMHDEVDKFLEKTGLSFRTMERDIAILNFNAFIKDLYISKFISINYAKKLHKIFINNEALYLQLVDKLKDILLKLDEGTLDLNDAVKDIKSIIDTQEEVLSYGDIDRATFAKQYNKKIRAIAKELKTAQLGAEVRRSINIKLKEVLNILNQDKRDDI